MTLLVFGKGFLGQRLAKTLDDVYLSPADITDAISVSDELRLIKPDAVINAAGKTGKPNVDWCESHQAATYKSNVIGPLVLAEACAKRNTYLLHLASGCIFYGDYSPSAKGWNEDDFANPISFYSRTKYAADLVLSKMPDVGIVRLRMPIDSAPNPRNLITKLASYKQIVDVENSVTIVDDLIQVIDSLIALKAEGVFHATNPGKLQHSELLAMYKRLVEPSHTFELIDEDALVKQGLAVAPRSNCILQSRRLDALGLAMRPIHEALEETMTQYAQHLHA